VLTDTNTTPTILKRQAWAYDAAGNRTVDQTDDAVFASTHDELNRLQARAPGGPIVFAGSLNEAGTVTIDGKPATVDGSNNFRGTAQVNAGTSTVTLMARDASGNQTTQQYEVDTSGSTTGYTYDANGNLTSDGTKTYVWNALNQLVEVKEGTTTVATFEYDGKGRRTEKTADGVTRAYIYDVEDIVEERISGSSSDTIRYYHGARIDEPLARKDSSDVVTYYLADHLGSVVQETSESGSVSLEREYDPWGQLLQGSTTSGYGFTGREWDAEVQLNYFRARYQDPATGQFLREDPIWTPGSLFSYVANGPLTHTDPTGQFIWVLPFVPAALTAAEAAVVATVGVLVTATVVEKIKNTWSSSDESEEGDPQEKKLTPGEIRELSKHVDIHELKGPGGGKYDLFKDRDGNIKIKPKDGSGPGEDTGININICWKK
jgi:RHS repeat-associated protein